MATQVQTIQNENERSLGGREGGEKTEQFVSELGKGEVRVGIEGLVMGLWSGSGWL